MRLLKVSPILVIILILIGYLIFLRFNNSQEINVDKQSKIPYKPKEFVNFKAFMKVNNIPLNPEFSNEYESITDDNIYLNKYFGIKIDLPDDWKIDRGITNDTFVKATLEDSLKTISVIGISELNNENSEELASKFQENPTQAYYKLVSGGENIRSYLMRNLNKQGIVKIKDLQVDNKDINSIRYITFDYWYDVKQYENTVEMVMYNFQTVKNNTIFSITYSCPNKLNDYKTIEKVISSIIISN